MREKKFTPGPWNTTLEIPPNVYGNHNDKSSDEEPMIAMTDVDSCDSCKSIYYGPPFKEIQANAQLISAAPELLEELEKHCKKCEKKKKLFDAMNGTETLKYSCEKCSTRTAIAKAYGE